MENHWNQFTLVLWKHVYMNRIRRHWAGTLFQVLAMVVLQYGVWEESVAPYGASPNKERSFDMTKPMDLWGQRNRSAPKGRVAFAPPSNPFGEVVRRACDRLGDLDPVPLANATALNAYLRRWENGTGLLLGVQFEARDNDTNGSSSSSSLSYALRAPFGTFDLQLQYKRHLLIPGPKDIGRFGEITILLPLQYAVESAFIDIIAESRQKNATRHVELQRLPYPRLFYGSRKSEERTLSLTALRFAIGFFVPFGVVVVSLVREKRSGMKGMLRRAGLSDGFYWLGHMAEGVFVVALSLAVMYVMLFGIYNQRGTTFLFYADSTLVMAVLMVFGLLTILHAMLLSVFLWNVCVSFAVAVVYWTLLSLAPYLWLQQVFGVGYYLVPRGRKIATSLSPAMFLHWCFRVIERFEKYGISISWKHFFDKSTTMDNVSVGELVLISLNACMALLFFVWYLDNIAPWNYGVPKSFYFPLSMDYWFPYRKWNLRSNMQTTDPNIYEPDPKSSEPIIHIINVSKETTNSSYPLDRVNLTVFNNQITVFLGPENSGHKTLLKIITGTDVPSSGNAYICNFDVVNNPSKCWEFLSYCPSEIILFSDLTVKEHLLFFASLRQLDGEEAEEAVETVMRHLHLVNCKDELVSELSQKTQRMLCLAIVTCTVNQGATFKNLYVRYAQTPVLMIDEPTRLMDPKSRHEIWCLLSRASRKCSVVLLTKSIEEAETLGDRVVIMRDGRVCCCGSPLWLKDRFGIGDCLRFTKFPHFRGDAVRKLIHAYMGAIRRRQDSRIEVIYWLGTLRNITKMAALVRTLDRRRTALGIAVMSVTSTTLEDVYLKTVGIPDFKGTGQELKTLPSLAEYEASMEKQGGNENVHAELEALQQLCTTRTSSPSALSVLGTLLDKRFRIWTRIWWFKSLSLLLPLLTLILLGLTIRLVRFEPRPYQRSITYNAAAVFDRSYGFVEGDGSQNHFLNDFMRPVLVENGVNLLVVNGTFMERELLQMADEDIKVYIFEYQYGVSLHKNDRVFLWYNGQCPHSGPLVVNMYHTALLRSLSGERRSTITLVNSPVLDDDSVQRAIFESQQGKLASDQTDDTFSKRNTLSLVLNSFFVSLAMGFYSACHLVEPIRERLSGFKHLQLMTGMSGSLYWIGHLLFDGAGAMVSSCVFMVAFIFCHDTLPVTYWAAMWLLMLAYCFAMLPLIYLCTMVFSESDRAYFALALTFMLAGIVGSLTVELFDLLAAHAPSLLMTVAIVSLGFLCRWFPTYSFSRGIIKLVLLARYNAVCTTGGELLKAACSDGALSTDDRIRPCCEALQNNGSAELLQPLGPGYETGFFETITLVAEGLFYLGVLFLADSQLLHGMRWHLNRKLLGTSDDDNDGDGGPRLVVASMDPEVEREQKQVEKIFQLRDFKDVIMAVRGLTKSFGCMGKKGLEKTSFLLRKNECLGIAGLNGSGKSVLMKLLAGDLTATGGNAYMAGLTLSGDLRRWQMAIGYSFDGRLGLVPMLTGSEMLDLVARLRGISPVTNRRLVVSSTLALLSPLQGDKLCDDYTVTEQKLLSLGIAIVGVPPILLLDEPYSDVEPFFRHQIVRFLQILKSVRATTMVISAHRLSHCEELCDRAIVLEDGKIETMGDYDQMNHKFGRCYMIKMRLPADRRADKGLQRQLIELMQEEFHQCAPCYNYKGMLAFRVGKTYTNWSEVYSKVAALKSNLGLPEVFVGDISFEDILVGLARCQILTVMIRPNIMSAAPSKSGSPRSTRGMFTNK